VLRSSLALAACVIALAGCATGHPTPPPDPFKVPRAQFARNLEVVAIAPMRTPKDLPNAEMARARFAATFAVRLQQVGVKCLSPDVVGPVYDEVVEGAGGIFDAKTGALDLAKLQGARKETLARLQARFGRVDAILFSDVRAVKASFSNDQASWNGTNEYVGTGTGKKVFFLNKHSGTLGALSLVVRLTGAEGTDLYVDAGGIQVLHKIDVEGQFVPVPEAELLANDQRNGEAVTLANAALVDAIREARGQAATPGTPAP
jgi:hypothetical protein